MQCESPKELCNFIDIINKNIRAPKVVECTQKTFQRAY